MSDDPLAGTRERDVTVPEPVEGRVSDGSTSAVSGEVRTAG